LFFSFFFVFLIDLPRKKNRRRQERNSKIISRKTSGRKTRTSFKS